MHPTRLRKYGVLAGLFLLLACAFAARVVPAWGFVFHAPGDVRLFGVDSYFHLRHSEFSARHFPHLQRNDIATQYPNGKDQRVPGLFDLAIGGSALIVGLGHPDDLTIAGVAAWMPVLLCLAVFWALYLLGRALLGRGAAVFAGALFLLYPGLFRDRSMLGFPDHHVAETLLAVLTVLGLVRLVQSAEDGTHQPPWWRPAFLHALPLALFAFTWHGAPLHFIIVGVTLFVYFTGRLAAGDLSGALGIALVRYGSGLAIWILAGLVWPDLVMFRQVYPLLLASCLLLAASFPFYERLARWFLARGVPVLWMTSLALPAAALLVWGGIAAMPESLQPERLLEVKQKGVGEHGDVTLLQGARLFGLSGWFAFVAIVAITLAAVAGRLRGRSWGGIRAQALIPLTYAGSWTGLWVWADDYGYILAPFFALAATTLVVALAHTVSLSRSSLRPWAAAAGGAVLLAGVLLPIRSVRPTIMPWPTDAELDGFMLTHDGWVQALEWMRTQTPEPTVATTSRVESWDGRRGGFHYPEGTYGVMSAWDFGNHISALAKRCVVNSQGASGLTDDWLFVPNENFAHGFLKWACETGERVPYVVLDAHTLGDLVPSKLASRKNDGEAFQELLRKHSFHGYEVELFTFGERFLRSIAARLYLGDAQELGRFRLIYESPHQSYSTYRMRVQQRGRGLATMFKREVREINTPQEYEAFSGFAAAGIVETEDGLLYEGEVLSSVKVFENVKGVTLAGSAEPGQIVRARITLRVQPTGRVLEYRRTLEVGPDSRFELMLAHSTERSPTGTAVVAESPCRVYVRRGQGFSQVAELEISEDQVQSGSVIELKLDGGG